MTAALRLARQLKSVRDHLPEAFAIRLHRAVSWLKAAEEQAEDPDLCFISLWIACNCCYAVEESSGSNERDRFGNFVKQLVALDGEERLHKLLWNEFSGPVRLLIDNEYVFAPFWEAQRGMRKNWKQAHEQSKTAAYRFLADRNVEALLQLVLDRLYILRNQLVHGGATYKSKLNRSPLRHSCQLLQSLLPVIIDMMIAHPEADWGGILYPPVR